jgi:biopolymer transport protein ExbB/TolQ
MLTEKLLQAALVGTEWVLWLLIFLSVVSVAVMIERFLYFRALEASWEKLRAKVEPLLRMGDLQELKEALARSEGSEAEVLKAGLEGAKKGREAAEKMVHGALTMERQRLEKRLTILGTLGNNAPFIGLFGTVLGIIRAFHDLAVDVKGGAPTVMAGISEALVATAMGLFVAIPAVVAYNYFMRRISRFLAHIQVSADTLLAFMPDKRQEKES